jgi:hypothetical protein
MFIVKDIYRQDIYRQLSYAKTARRGGKALVPAASAREVITLLR